MAKKSDKYERSMGYGVSKWEDKVWVIAHETTGKTDGVLDIFTSGEVVFQIKYPGKKIVLPKITSKELMGIYETLITSKGKDINRERGWNLNLQTSYVYIHIDGKVFRINRGYFSKTLANWKKIPKKK